MLFVSKLVFWPQGSRVKTMNSDICSFFFLDNSTFSFSFFQFMVKDSYLKKKTLLSKTLIHWANGSKLIMAI